MQTLGGKRLGLALRALLRKFDDARQERVKGDVEFFHLGQRASRTIPVVVIKRQQKLEMVCGVPGEGIFQRRAFIGREMMVVAAKPAEKSHDSCLKCREHGIVVARAIRPQSLAIFALPFEA